MKRTALFLVLVFTLITIPPAFAQEWTAEQKEVWNAAEKLAEYFFDGDIESLSRDYVHKDFIFWNSSVSVPGDKETADKLDKTWVRLGGEFDAVNVVPLTIQVYENFAIVNAYSRGYVKDPGKDPVMMTTRWHSTWKKEEGKWLQIANYAEQRR
jgi:hypothetical protein